MHFKNWLLHRVTIRSSDQFWGVMVDRRFGIQLLLTGEFHALPAVSKSMSFTFRASSYVVQCGK